MAERINGPRAVVGVRRRATEVSIRATEPELRRYFRRLAAAILGGEKAASPSETDAMVRDLYRATMRATGDRTGPLYRELKAILDRQYLQMTETVWEEIVGIQVGRRLAFDLNARGVQRILGKVGTRITQINASSQRMIASRVQAELNRGSNADVLETSVRGLLQSWGEDGGRAHIIALTESGFAYNFAAVEGYRESGIVESVQVYDGPECGWTSHDDPDMADGSVRSLEEAEAWPLAHPHCQRAFGPTVVTDEAAGTAPSPAPAAPGEPPAPASPTVPEPVPEPVQVTPQAPAPPPVQGLPDDVARYLEKHHDLFEQGSPVPGVSGGSWGSYGDAMSARVRAGWVQAAADAGIPVETAYAQGARILQETADDLVLSTRRSMKSIERILSEGRFKSQFETNTSGGALNQDLRARAEEFMFGYDKAVDVTKRPIYGYLRKEGASDGAAWYGDVLMDLKPAVRERTTAVWGDSLGLEAQPSPLSRIRATSYSPRSIGNRDSLPRPGRTGSPYTEAQIHGGLRIEDVARITFEREPLQSLVRKVEAAGFVEDKTGPTRWTWIRP
jgi:hypothetical protein